MDINTRIISIFNSSIENNENGDLVTNLRETEKTEFKKSIYISADCLSKDYLKTICAFANNKGGVMIFGVRPNSFVIEGIKSKYHELDNRYASTLIKQHIQGSLEFDLFTHQFGEKVVGFLTIGQANKRPVILKENYQVGNETLNAGEIYFRYPGQSRRIDFNDLETLIEQEAQDRFKKLTEKLHTIMSVGPDKIDLMKTETGEILLGNEKSKLVLDKEILDQLNLIKEGKIVEVDGAPAYVIKGYINSEDVVPVQSKVKEGIRDTDLYLSFLKQSSQNPVGYLIEILYKPTFYFPVFFWGIKSNKEKDVAIELIQQYKDTSVRKSIRNKIVVHLRKGYNESLGSIIVDIVKEDVINADNQVSLVEDLMQKYKIKGFNRHKSVARTISVILLESGKEPHQNFVNTYLKEVIDSITHLNKSIIIDQKDLILKLLQKIYNEILKESRNAETTAFRKAICYIDYHLYFNEWK